MATEPRNTVSTGLTIAEQIQNAIGVLRTSAESLARSGCKVVDGQVTAPCGCAINRRGDTRCNH